MSPTTALARPPRWWRRPLTLTTTIAVLLHLPFTPAMPLLRTLHRLSILKEPPREEDPPDPIELPIELVEPPRPEPTSTEDNSVPLPPPAAERKAAERKAEEAAKKQAAEGKKQAEEAARKQAAEARKKAESGKKQAKQEAPGPREEDREVGRFAQGEEPQEDNEKAPAEPHARDSKDQAPRRADAVGLKGKLDDRVKGKPAVSLALWMGSVRAHPMAGAVGELMACNPEWKPFLQKGVDPLRDLEGFLMVGPQITSARKATIAVQHRVDDARIKEVFDALIRRSGPGGRWLQEGVARVLIQRSERVLFTHPESMIFVAPPANWRDIHGLSEPISLPEARGRALGLTLQKPAQVLRRFAVELPPSLTELRLDLYANRDGGVDAQLDLIDASEAAATSHVAGVNRMLRLLISDTSQLARAAASLTPDGVKGDIDEEDLRLPLPEVSAVGERLTTTLHLSTTQTGKLLGLFHRLTCARKGAPKARP